MLPLLLLQLFYKVVYLLAVGLPLEFRPDQELSIVSVFIGGVVMDLVAIPWPYVVSRFARARGDRWSDQRHGPTAHSSDYRSAETSVS